MRHFIISVIALTFLVGCANKSKNNSTIEALRVDSLQKIVLNLAENKTIGDNIGIGGSTARLYLYKQLNKIATPNELIFLTNHENPAVRYYSFRALVNRRSDSTFNILLRHMNDTIRLESFSGCSFSEETVVWNLFKLVTISRLEPTGYKLTTPQYKIIDSIYRIYGDPVYGQNIEAPSL